MLKIINVWFLKTSVVGRCRAAAKGQVCHNIMKSELLATTTCHVWKVLNAPRSCTTITLLIPGVSCLLLNSTFQEQQIGCCYFAVVVISLAQKASNFLLNRLLMGMKFLGLDQTGKNWQQIFEQKLFNRIFCRLLQWNLERSNRLLVGCHCPYVTSFS